MLPTVRGLKSLSLPLRVAQDLAVHLVTLTVKPQLVKAWKLQSVRADQGSVLVCYCNMSALALLSGRKLYKISPFLETLAKRGALCRRALFS